MFGAEWCTVISTLFISGVRLPLQGELGALRGQGFLNQGLDFGRVQMPWHLDSPEGAQRAYVPSFVGGAG